VLQWSEITILAAVFAGFAAGGWILRRDPAQSVWIGAFCALLASGLGNLLSERLPFLLAPALGVSSLFPVLLLAGVLREAGRDVPRWLVPAGFALGLARAGFYVAGLEVGTILLALAAEPPAVVAAAVIYHRHVVSRRSSRVRRLIVPGLLLVAALEAWDALRDLSFGAGQTPWISWTLVGAVLATLLIVSAIDEARSARALAELALREAQERFRRLSEHSKDMIGEVGPDGRVTYVSPNQREVLGYEPEELLGRHVVDIAAMVGASSLEALPAVAPLADLKAAGPLEKTWRVRRKDGTWCWFETDAHSYRNSGGELCALAVSRNVTERVEAEEERHEIEAQMQQARRLESLGVLAGGIAHDFNNLLVGILSNAEMALEDLEPESPVRLRAEGIKRASERASELTQQLLAYAGKADVSLETFDLGVLVRELAQLLRASLPKTAELRVELEEEAPWIHADATQVRQVVMNLITNASDALEGRPGVVTVRTGMMHVDHGDLARCCFAEGLDAGKYAYVEVGDTGRGIEAEQLNHIFDPFFTTKFQGRGLGLAAVAGVVRGHRGAVSVESEPSHGTRVRVFLPRAVEAVELMGEVSVSSEWRGQGTVLVVDDDEMVRTAAGLLIERLGFSVLSASSGAEAVELFRKNSRKVSCVLLDVTMPVMDGEETFWLLREIRADVPVLFMSGHSSRDIDSRLLGKTRVDRLRKPFHRAELERELRGVLEEGSPESTTTPGA
jgi:two-component system cell cycle sensor histidine kinase/response regulator CckA